MTAVGDPEGIRQAADEILAGEEFAPEEDPLLERIIDWIGDHLVPDWLFGGNGTGPGALGYVVLALLLAGAVLLLARLRPAAPPRRGAAEPSGAERDEHRTAEDWQRIADEAEAAGRWSDAVVAQYRSAVRSLVDEGALSAVPGRTTGEFRRELRSTRPGSARAFDEASSVFDLVRYGGADIDRSTCRDTRALLEQVGGS